MKTIIDREAKAAYITISTKPIQHSVVVTDSLVCDVDKEGDIVGIECINISAQQIKILQENISHVAILEPK